MSIVLLLGALYGLMRAAMLCFAPVNRTANRWLAALIVVLALFTFPYIVGYAGYYDAYPWLSFFPYNLTLAVGPLLYLYFGCLTGAAQVPPARWWLHLLPVLAQLLYYCAVFSAPLAFKNNWDATVHVPYIDPVETIAMLGSLSAYWVISLKRYRRIEKRRDDGLSEWARNFLIALGLTLAFWVVLHVAELAWNGLTYFQRFPFYLWLSIVVCYLGTEGYWHGAIAFPVTLAPLADPKPSVPDAAPISQAEQAARWRQRVIDGAWWRDPELNLAELAKRLGTNTTSLSRAINEGLGLNFTEMINRMRVDAIVEAMKVGDEDQPVLDIALSEGFNSKASFNRAFKLYTGETPTEYRRRFAASASVSDSAQ